MIEHTAGDIIKADAEALVNTVNTEGVMGKGIALQFRQAFPENNDAYVRACKRGEVQPGKMFVHRTGWLHNPRFIVNFPTKRHWRQKSRLEDIEEGLNDLVAVLRHEGIESIAVPPLGCGNGGLNWSEVRPRIEAALSNVSYVRVLLYAPEGAPAAEAMCVATTKPRLSSGRLALLGLFENYALPGYRLSMLEVQKLVYFLKAAGEPFVKMEFDKAEYGPYTEVLHHMLQRIEGHYIRGYGDRSQGASMYLLPNVAEAARAALAYVPETAQRLQRVAELIEGFETPYGLELLSTVHWLANEDPEVKEDVTAAIRGVHAWNERKRATFEPRHIEIAWHQLREHNWI